MLFSSTTCNDFYGANIEENCRAFFLNNIMPKPKWRIQDCVAKLKENSTNKPEVQAT